MIGPNANSRAALIGNYHGTSSRYITVLEGIQDCMGEDVRVFYSEGCHLFKDRVENLGLRQDRISEAVAVAKNSDVVVLCLGLDETLEGEEGDTGNSYASGDKVDLLLPEVQRELLEAVVAAGKPVILVNMTGSAMDLRYAQEHCAAIVQAWYPGARGGRVVADILTGEISPSGKLPVTFYRDTEELPDFEDYSMKGRTYRYFTGEVLYPFGYGLTYGSAEISSVKLDGQELADGSEAGLPGGSFDSLEVTVSNTGDRDVEEVVQVYIKALDSADATPNERLCGFARVSVKTGGQAVVQVPVDRDALTVINDEGEKVSGGSRYAVSVGFGQSDARTEELTGKKCRKIILVTE